MQSGTDGANMISQMILEGLGLGTQTYTKKKK